MGKTVWSIICRRLEGKPCQGNVSPPLPQFRVQRSHPFQTTGVDFAGPLYVRSSNPGERSKVWLCLYTCCSTRAVHLDVVPDMTASSFLRSVVSNVLLLDVEHLFE